MYGSTCFSIGGNRAAFSALILFMHVLSSSTEPSDNNKWHNFHANSYELNASEARALPFQDEIAGSSQITITLNSSPKLYQEEAGSAQEMDHRKRRHSRHKHNWFKGSKWKHLLQKRAANKNLEQISGKLDYKSFPNCWTTPQLSNQRRQLEPSNLCQKRLIEKS
ncbi:hypothetical protein TCAL_00638 [Tigriopus californicus]|uniref:Uncharacterized protein n=1 Tax=Tigriopus californicus TaxID=6832 RepID=A0A553PDQ9_TIGCA|nr:uncharacterized protein LOC131877028 [Tigriopus californicus]TRY75818.1 hypothetical protein TCAL_00638 [Tigriopus californicus]